jgi:hypothetical protein
MLCASVKAVIVFRSIHKSRTISIRPSTNNTARAAAHAEPHHYTKTELRAMLAEAAANTAQL